jgi:hypothetical protein
LVQSLFDAAGFDAAGVLVSVFDSVLVPVSDLLSLFDSAGFESFAAPPFERA